MTNFFVLKKGNTEKKLIYIVKGGFYLKSLKEEYYNLKTILNDENLLLNLRLDIIFKKVFLKNDSKKYLCLLISNVFDISYKDLFTESILINGELPSKNLEKRSSYTDIVLRFRNIDFIIEMNYHTGNYIVEKNDSYLFNLHTSKIFNENNYGKDIYTYLLNIDDYDLLEKEELIYEGYLNNPKYNICMYENIKIKHINLAYIKNKLYNTDRRTDLTNFEKILIIFVCQRKDIILKLTNNYAVKGVIKIMEKLKLDVKLPTYDYEEFLRQERIGFEKKNIEFEKKNTEFEKKNTEFEKKNTEFEKKNTEFEKKNIEFEKKNNEFNEKYKDYIKKQEKFNNEKKSIVREFKKLGIPLKKISEITKLPIEQIKTLL